MMPQLDYNNYLDHSPIHPKPIHMTVAKKPTISLSKAGAKFFLEGQTGKERTQVCGRVLWLSPSPAQPHTQSLLKLTVYLSTGLCQPPGSLYLQLTGDFITWLPCPALPTLPAPCTGQLAIYCSLLPQPGNTHQWHFQEFLGSHPVEKHLSY